MPMFHRSASIMALALSAGLAAPPAIAQETAAPPTEGRTATSEFVELAPRLIDAVVNITAVVAEAAPNGEASPSSPATPFEDFFGDFFGNREGDPDRPQLPQPPEQRGSAVGSGFLIDPQGYIVTNHHVVKNATSVTVTLHDETEYEAEIVGLDQRTDLALLKIEASDALPFVKWGDSKQSRIGEPVLAIGNPFGLGGTVTSGIISALARDLGIGPYDEFMQTDASINRGNSGGPVFNTRGEVIGVATAIFSPSGGNIGIGFATPSAVARSVVEQLREKGEVSRGWIGVAIQPVNEELAGALGLETPRGVLVADVTTGAPADAAGIEVGDVLLEFAGETIGERVRLPRLVADTGIGSKVPVKLWRNGSEVIVDLTVGDLSAAPSSEPDVRPSEPEGTDAEGGLGLQLSPIEPEMRDQLGLEAGAAGVLVAGVEPDSVAAERGLRTGDVIMRVGREEVARPEDVVKAVQTAQKRGDSSILMLIERQGASRFVALPVSVG